MPAPDNLPDQEPQAHPNPEPGDNITTGPIHGTGVAIGRDARAKVVDNRRGFFFERVRIPLVVLGLLFLVIAVPTLITAVANSKSFGDTMRDLFQLPQFPAEQPGETLIIVVPFFYSEGVKNTDAAHLIAEQIRQELITTTMRVEIIEGQTLRGEDQATAKALAERYRASMIIWGSDVGVEVRVNFLNLRQPDSSAAEVEVYEKGEKGRTQLANPQAYAGFITEDLPNSMAFLSLFAVGQAASLQQNYPSATRIISHALELLQGIDPPVQGTADAYFRLGWLHQIPGKNASAALADYNQTLALDPTYALAYNNRGIIYYAQRDYPAALRDFNQALALDPTYVLAYNNRGNVYAAQQDYPAALADYNQTLALDPTYALAYNNRGIIYYAQQDYPAALADYNQALTLDPTYAAAYINRGIVYDDQQDYPAALTDYNQALTLDPSYVAAYINRGIIYYAQQDYPAALADYNQALALNSNYAIAYANRGLVYYAQKDYAAALADYTQALALDPKNANAYYNRGLLYKQLGKREQAIADFQKALALFTDAQDIQNTKNRLKELGAE